MYIRNVHINYYINNYDSFLKIILGLFAAVEHGQLEKARNILTTCEVQVNR